MAAAATIMDREQFSWPLDGPEAKTGGHWSSSGGHGSDLDWWRCRQTPSVSPARATRSGGSGHRNHNDWRLDAKTRGTLSGDVDRSVGSRLGNRQLDVNGTRASKPRGNRPTCSCCNGGLRSGIESRIDRAFMGKEFDLPEQELIMHGSRSQQARDTGRDINLLQGHHTPQRAGGGGGGGGGGLGASREDAAGPSDRDVHSSANNPKRRQSPKVQRSTMSSGHGNNGDSTGLQEISLPSKDRNLARTSAGGGIGRGRSRQGRSGGGSLDGVQQQESLLERAASKKDLNESGRDCGSLPSTVPPPLSQTHPAFIGQAVCPTPYVLGSVCARGEREYPRWRSAPSSTDLLGNHAQMMADTAKYVFDIVVGAQGSAKVLRMLSAADGCADDMLPDIQAKYVPTSVMLAHTFMASQGAWQEGRARVHVFGADLRNAVWPWWQQQALPWQMPPWLAHRFVGLDNNRDFLQQLYSNGQCPEDLLFDAVLVRQGLCFCDDPSKQSATWPIEVAVTQQVEGPVCGIYQLEPFLKEGRPAYRKGNCVLQWCPQRGEWAVLDEAGGAWAYARADVGHPVLARGPWNVWNGTAHVSDGTFACNLAQYGTPPWQRPVSQRICCCGVTGDMESMAMLLLRISAVLDPYNFHSFSLVHGAWTNGTRTEVDELHKQIEDATRLYNARRRGPHVAAVLRRTAASHNHYWLQCDGIILFQPGSRADPYAAYGPGAVFDNTLSFYNPNPLPGAAQ